MSAAEYEQPYKEILIAEVKELLQDCRKLYYAKNYATVKVRDYL